MDHGNPSVTDTGPSQPPKHSRQRNNSSTEPLQPKKPRKQRAKAALAPATPARESTPATVDHARISNVRDQPQSEAAAPRYTTHPAPYPGAPPPQQPYVYAMNGNPYQPAPSQYHPQTQSASPAQVGPGISGHAQYPPYAVTHPAYGYSPYTAYPSMVMYGAAGPSHAPHASHAEQPSAEPSPPPPSATTGKRKNSMSDSARATSSSNAAAQAEAKKRTKTQRACDSCRSRKIRCDVLAETDPPECQHCKQYGFDCTFFLPITETRFKKKRLEQEAEAEKEKERSTHSPHADGARSSDIRVFGPTSPAYLLHSQALISSRTYENYDTRYHHSWDVSASGDGVIQVHEPQPTDSQSSHTKPVDLRIERDVIETLVNAYFREIAPILPIVTREEFIASSPPQPILLYSVCLVAAARREVSQQVFDSVRYAVNSLIKAEDVLSTASIVNMQSLLVLSMVGDCHSSFAPSALSTLWVRLGSAIRMAQDLGLHRAEAVKQNIELRRRLWSICVILDRWVSVTFGHPFMIDVGDCDARLPSSGDERDMYIDQLVRLSVIVGKVMKNIYTPAGLNVTNDVKLQGILDELDNWKAKLPPELQFRGPETPISAGILYLLYCCVNMLFWRVFMRISYTCPEHIKFALTVTKWTELVQLTGHAIDWLDANERAYDVWMLVSYCSTLCAFVQYHTYGRRAEEEALDKLRKLRDCVRRWEASINSDHMSARRKTAEIISLLYEDAQTPSQNTEPPALNPTGGVTVKAPLSNLVFRKDHSRPGGGVFIAHDAPKEAVDKNLPEGLIIHVAPEAAMQHQAHDARMTSSYPQADPSYATNMNPSLPLPPGHVHVMNLNMVPQFNQSNDSSDQFTLTDPGILDTIPAQLLYEWNAHWDFLPRMPGQQQQQQQQQQLQYPHPTQNEM
ncbi:fungal-specific transcription factor domain-containing protein [Cytidiella melzeri]|nr:fungal-specific transcription factor domain-containing protein [Cytidiella melzeri]